MGRQGGVHQARSMSGRAARMGGSVIIRTTAVPGSPHSTVWLGPRQTHGNRVLLFNYSDANLTAYKLGRKTLGLNFWLSATPTAVLPLLVNIFTNFQQLPLSPVLLSVSKYVCSIFIPSCFPCKLCTLCPPPSQSFGSSAL